MAVHRGGIRLHIFGQISGPWLERLSNEKPGLHFINISFLSQLDCSRLSPLIGMGPEYTHGLENFCSTAKLFVFVCLSTHIPLFPAIFFEEHLGLHRTSSKKEKEPSNFANMLKIIKSLEIRYQELVSSYN